MSNYISETARQVYHDVKHLPADEVSKIHGIEIHADGTVYCSFALKTYPTLDSWIAANAEEDFIGFEKFSKYEYSDD